jgi:chromosomal replication initiator protein
VEEDVLTINESWVSIRDSIQSKVQAAAWQAGLSSLQLVDISENVITLGVPNQIQFTRINQRFMPLLEESSRSVLGDHITVQLTVRSEYDAPSSLSDPEADLVAPPPATAAPVRPSTPAESTGRLDPRMTFESYVQGSSNRLAFAAAQTVAETPGRAYNPLMIYGKSGLGKTHLLHAIGNYIHDNYPNKRVLYVSTETFLSDFIRAIQQRTQMALQERYRECDVLLIDDIQFMLTRGDSFHEEIFHTYNTLHGQGKQVVLTSDQDPRDLTGLQERFRSRLLQGLVTEVDQPDLETRIAILRVKAEADGVTLPHDVVEFIANRVRDNIRELEGSVTMLRAHANLRQEPISLDLAKKYLTNLGSEQIVLRPDAIMTTVADYFGLSVPELTGPKRLRPLVHARHIAMFLMRELLSDYSYPMIAKLFDNRNHTTVISAVEKVKTQLTSNAEMFNQVNALRRQLEGETR